MATFTAAAAKEYLVFFSVVASDHSKAAARQKLSAVWLGQRMATTAARYMYTYTRQADELSSKPVSKMDDRRSPDKREEIHP